MGSIFRLVMKPRLMFQVPIVRLRTPCLYHFHSTALRHNEEEVQEEPKKRTFKPLSDFMETKEPEIEEEEEDNSAYVNPVTGEVNGPRGPEPTRYGDWEKNGRCSDF